MRGSILENSSRIRTNLWKIAKHSVVPSLFYFIMFCVLTYPLILKFSTYFFTDAGDGLQNIWNLWWVNLAIRHPDVYPTIWQTNLLHWPYGTTLFGQTLNPFNGFLAVFLRRFLSPILTFNTIILFSFIVGGMSMYWLAHSLTKSFWGSILAGFIFTFSNYHFMHAQGHLQLVALEWIPLFVLCWYYLITKPQLFTAISAAIVLWLVLLCDYYYFFYCFLIAIIIVLWYAVIIKDAFYMVRKNHFLPLATFTVIAILLNLPIVGPLIIGNYRDPLSGFHEPLEFSLDMLALIIPGGHWRFYRWTQFFWSKLPGNINESSVYLGISVYGLLGYAWIKRKTQDLVTKQQILLWTLITGIFILLALGPALQIGGKIIWDKVMPYTLLANVFPFLRLSGVPVRMMVMVILGASLLSAIGLRELLRQFPHNITLTIVLLSLLLFETLPKPLPYTRIEVPKYVIALANLPNDGGVVDLVTSGFNLPLYFQTIHGKPIAFGYVSRLPLSVSTRDAALAQTIQDKNIAKLWDTYHIRYIITHETIRAQATQPYISIETVYDDNDIRIYRIGCICEGEK